MSEYQLSPTQQIAVYEKPVHPTYTFKPIKYKWLSRLVWKFLLRVKAVHGGLAHPIKHFTYGDMEREKLSNYIRSAIFELMERGESTDNYALVIGAKDMQELLSTEMYGDYTVNSGSFGVNIRGEDYFYEKLPINVIATVSGFALIPKIIIEK